MSVAFSTKSKILLTVEFLYSSVTFTSIIPSTTILPDNTFLFSETCVNLLSPVKEAVFKSAVPFVTIPSSGTFSPSLTKIISPIFTSSGETCLISFSVFKFAYSGLISIRSLIDFLLLLIDFSSSIFPISYRIITIRPSICSPTK